MKKLISAVFLTAVFAFGFLQTGFCLTEQEMGQSAETAGKWREALTHYLSAIQSLQSRGKEFISLTERIIAIFPKVDPPPALPEEAKQHMIRGEAAVEIAKDDAGLKEAWVEFAKALLIAPWYAKGYFNLALVSEKRGYYEDAVWNLKHYLLADPNAPDAEEVRAQITKLEYKQEKAVEAESKEAEQLAKFDFLLGKWKYSMEADNAISFGTLTMTMKNGKIEGYEMDQNVKYLLHVVSGPSERHLGSDQVLVVRGTPQGPDPANIKWEMPRSGGQPSCAYLNGFVETHMSVSPDQNKITFQYPFVHNRHIPGQPGNVFSCEEEAVDYILTRP